MTAIEVTPSGLFNRHHLSFVLQEMDAADDYPRFHKYFMGKAEVLVGRADEFSLPLVLCQMPSSNLAAAVSR